MANPKPSTTWELSSKTPFIFCEHRKYTIVEGRNMTVKTFNKVGRKLTSAFLNWGVSKKYPQFKKEKLDFPLQLGIAGTGAFTL